MIAIEDIENHILTNTNEKVISCLRLCGFKSFEDYILFNETTLDWIEKHVGIRCSMMDPDKRLDFIEEFFINEPLKYMFSIPLRTRLLNSVYQLHKESQRLQQIINEASHNNDVLHKSYSGDTENIDESISSSHNEDIHHQIKPESIKVESSLKVEKFDFIKTENSLEPISEIYQKFYEEIIQYASEEFIECFLVPKTDFELFLPDFESDKFRFVGRFQCLICSFNKKKRSTVIFKIQTNNKIQFTKIKKHLSEHFTQNPDATEIRKHNRAMKRKAAVMMKKSMPIKDLELPKEIIAAQKNVVREKDSIPTKRVKITSLLSEIMPQPKDVIPAHSNLQILSPELISQKTAAETSHEVLEFQPSTSESNLEDPIETVELVIKDNVTSDVESDCEETNLKICM